MNTNLVKAAAVGGGVFLVKRRSASAIAIALLAAALAYALFEGASANKKE